MLIMYLHIRLYLKASHTPMQMLVFSTPHSSQDVPENAPNLLSTIMLVTDFPEIIAKTSHIKFNTTTFYYTKAAMIFYSTKQAHLLVLDVRL